MNNNRGFTRQRKPSAEAIEALMEMYAKNAHLKTLVKTFNLDLRTAEVAPYALHTENTTRRNNSREIVKLYNMSTTNSKTATTKKKFQNEAEEKPLMPFVKFTNAGDVAEGFFIGETCEIKGDDGKMRKAFVMEIEGENHVIPTSVQLGRKLDNILLIHAEQIASGEPIEIQITFDGKKKIEGVVNPMNQYTVKY